LLAKVRDVGLPLISVSQVEPTAQTTGRKGVPMDSNRRTALVTGVLFIITFVTSIPAALLLYPRCWTTPTTSSVAAPMRS